MNIIIDTHIFLWALSEPLKISDKKRSMLEDLSNRVFVSAVSIAELMIAGCFNAMESLWGLHG